jgi:hypothetical protein
MSAMGPIIEYIAAPELRLSWWIPLKDMGLTLEFYPEPVYGREGRPNTPRLGALAVTPTEFGGVVCYGGRGVAAVMFQEAHGSAKWIGCRIHGARGVGQVVNHAMLASGLRNPRKLGSAVSDLDEMHGLGIYETIIMAKDDLLGRLDYWLRSSRLSYRRRYVWYKPMNGHLYGQIRRGRWQSGAVCDVLTGAYIEITNSSRGTFLAVQFAEGSEEARNSLEALVTAFNGRVLHYSDLRAIEKR